MAMGGWVYNSTIPSIPHKGIPSYQLHIMYLLYIKYRYTCIAHLLLGDKPLLKELQHLTNGCNKVTFIKCVASKWKELAMEMGYEYSDIESVNTKAQKDPQIATYEILGRWLTGSEGLCGPVTWSTLIKCLSNIECQSLADRLSDILL